MSDEISLEFRALPFNVSVDDSDKLSVSGLVNGAGSISEILINPSNGRKFRETISKGVFRDAINSAERIDFLAQHDKKQILSTTDNNSLNLKETDNGLEMSAKITKTTWGQDTYRLISDGIIKGMSFGMRVLKDNWKMSSGNIPLRTINKIELFEVSAVRNPAYKSSDIEARNINEIRSVDIPENILKEGDTMSEKRDDNEELTEEERKKQEAEEAKKAKDAKDKAKNQKDSAKDSKDSKNNDNQENEDNSEDPEDEEVNNEDGSKNSKDSKSSKNNVSGNEKRELNDLRNEVRALRDRLGAAETNANEALSFVREERAKKEEARQAETRALEEQNKTLRDFFNN